MGSFHSERFPAAAGPDDSHDIRICRTCETAGSLNRLRDRSPDPVKLRAGRLNLPSNVIKRLTTRKHQNDVKESSIPLHNFLPQLLQRLSGSDERAERRQSDSAVLLDSKSVWLGRVWKARLNRVGTQKITSLESVRIRSDKILEGRIRRNGRHRTATTCAKWGNGGGGQN